MKSEPSILLLLHNSFKEARHFLENRALFLDVLKGIDLLIENAGRRFAQKEGTAT